MVAWSAGAHAEATDGATRRTKAATALSSAVRALRCIPDPLLWWLPQAGGPYLKVSMRSSNSPRLYFSPRAAVAQLARASACPAEGRGFESHQPLRIAEPNPASARLSPWPTSGLNVLGGPRQPMMESLDRGKEAFPICGRKIDEVLQLAEGRRRGAILRPARVLATRARRSGLPSDTRDTGSKSCIPRALPQGSAAVPLRMPRRTWPREPSHRWRRRCGRGRDLGQQRRFPPGIHVPRSLRRRHT